MEKFERKTSLKVCRIMVPPHGACSEETLEALPQFGFEAACISHGSLHAHNSGKTWAHRLGYSPSELIKGCPILPRWGLTGQITNTILLAAYLGQPLVFRGHHKDLKGGLELLDDLGRFINGLGAVQWSNMTGLSRANYRWQIEGSTCRVRPLTRIVKLWPSKVASRLVVESPTDELGGTWRISEQNGLYVELRAGESFGMADCADGLTLTQVIPTALPPAVNGRTRVAPIALLRRVATESRDRFLRW
jgi:hypothetical protein